MPHACFIYSKLFLLLTKRAMLNLRTGIRKPHAIEGRYGSVFVSCCFKAAGGSEQREAFVGLRVARARGLRGPVPALPSPRSLTLPTVKRTSPIKASHSDKAISFLAASL